MRQLRPLVTTLLLLTALGFEGNARFARAQAPGFSTEPLLPVGKFAKAADVGWGISGYYSFRLGRTSPWAFVADVGAQWHAGDSIDRTEYPDLFPPDSTVDGDGIALSGWIFPIRASLTRILGRAYFSPRVGVYIPVGETKSRLGMRTSFGISPRLGHLFFVTRHLTADVGIEYTVIFDREPVMYVGFGFGFLFGGNRLPRRRLPY